MRGEGQAHTHAAWGSAQDKEAQEMLEGFACGLQRGHAAATSQEREVVGWSGAVLLVYILAREEWD